MLAGWGLYPKYEGRLTRAFSADDVARAFAMTPDGLIARGMGRAYGDAAIGSSATLSMLGLNHLRAFDPATGRLTVEAGVPLKDIVETFLPRGFFPPVVPGTRSVSVGGMIAADVHGKNHHQHGGFGHYLEAMTLALPHGEIVACSRGSHADLFTATIGGMGLTGVILDATFALQAVETGWIMQTTTVADGIEETLAALQAADHGSYSVAWIDGARGTAATCRALVFAGEHASAQDLAAGPSDAPRVPKARPGGLSIPDIAFPTPPSLSVAAFNGLYFRRGAARAGAPFLERWDKYFFPLDGIAHWNRVFGRRGLVQHQCVVPEAEAASVLPEIFERFRRMETKPVMVVLKKLMAGDGLLSFPMRGYTLAVDVPVTDDLFPRLAEIDRIVVAAGGRLYMAKDATQSRETFEAGYPNLPAFRDVRRAISAEGRLASRLSARLGL